MSDDRNEKAIESVRKHLSAMLEKLENMKSEQEEDLKTIVGSEKEQTELALAQTIKLIEELKKSQTSIEAALRS